MVTVILKDHLEIKTFLISVHADGHYQIARTSVNKLRPFCYEL
jgi:hypothetical protein